MNVVQQRQRQRFLFLKYLYETTGGSTLQYVAEQEIAKALGFTDNEQEQTSLYLRGERLITGVSGPAVALTHQGVVEIEAALAEPNKPTTHFPINILHIGQVSNAQIQQGTVGSTQSGSFSSMDMQAVAQLIQDLKTKLPDLGLADEDKQAVESDIATIEAQTSSPRPKMEIIKECLRTVRNIVEGIAGAGIIEGIKKLLGG